MDHLIKFHPFSFNIENLELIPEVITKDKSVESRRLIEELLFYLCERNVRIINFGRTKYKFLNKTKHELKYLGRIFEEESAAFNFTLDESKGIKDYLINKILSLRAIFGKSGSLLSLSSSIAFLNKMLGDAYFFDQEYDDALVSYSDGLEILEEQFRKLTSIDGVSIGVKTNINADDEKIKAICIEMFQLNVKNAITFEKIRNYLSAMGFYKKSLENLEYYCHNFKEKKDVNESLNYSSYLYVYELNFKVRFSIMYLACKEGKYKFVLKEFKIMLYEISELKQRFEIENDHHTIEYNNIMYKIMFNIGVFINVNNSFSMGIGDSLGVDIFTKSFFAEIIQVSFASGENNYYESNSNLFTNSLRYYFLSLMYKIEELIVTIGLKIKNDVYKNIISFIPKSKMYKINEIFSFQFNYNIFSVLALSFYILKETENKNLLDLKSLEEAGLTSSFLGDSIYSSINRKKVIINSNFCEILFLFYSTDELTEIISEFKDVYAFTNLGMNFDWKSIDERINNLFFSLDSEQKKLLCALICYLFSAKCFLICKNENSHSFELKKILVILVSVEIPCKKIVLPRNAIDSLKKDPTKFLVKEFIDKIVTKAIINLGFSVLSSNRNEISFLKHILRIEEGIFDSLQKIRNLKPDIAGYCYFSTSIGGELREIIYLWGNVIDTLELDISQNAENEMSKLDLIINQNSFIISQYTRIMELDKQVKHNIKFLEKNDLFPNYESIDEWFKLYIMVKATKIDKIKVKDVTSHEEFEKIKNHNKIKIVEYINEKIDWNLKLVKNKLTLNIINLFYRQGLDEYFNILINTIHSLRLLLKIYNKYGNSYYPGYYAFGEIHRQLGLTIMVYEVLTLVKGFLGYCDDKKSRNVSLIRDSSLNDELEHDKLLIDLIGNYEFRNLDCYKELQKSINSYLKCVELHNEGALNKKEMAEFVFFEDDFTDYLYHFRTALERQKINSGSINGKISTLRKFIGNSKISDYNIYYPNSV